MRPDRRLGLIGYGSIAKQTLAVLASQLATPLDAIICLAKADGLARARDMLETFGEKLAMQRIVANSIADFLNAKPDFVAEAAGHEALAANGVAVLEGGRDLIVTSVGALADDDLRLALDRAAALGGAHYALCAGAIGGLEILAAAKLAGLTGLVYTSRKPPSAWHGTAAENLVDLDNLAEPHQFFEGTARIAARDYPQNANVAATLALHGAGLDHTRVRLIADPHVRCNLHEISVRSVCADIDIRIAGVPSPENPKTSMTTGYALAAQILKRL